VKGQPYDHRSCRNPCGCAQRHTGRPGNGALANIALDRALADAPGYSMAELIRQAVSAGLPPSAARLPMTPAEVAASYSDRPGD
jgi:hypothetical protein